MKALFINGSPRKNFNTAEALESAMKGAQAAGAETELINLYELQYKGCMSCFACKLKNSKTEGVCAIKDALRRPRKMQRSRHHHSRLPNLLQQRHRHDAQLHGKTHVPRRFLCP